MNAVAWTAGRDDMAVMEQAVKQILTEYHNSRLAQEFAGKRGQPDILERISQLTIIGIPDVYVSYH